MEAGRRMVLVAPTFRDSRGTPIGLDSTMVARLDHWCESHAVEMVFKFHPHERNATSVHGRHLHLCRPGSDLYPLMPASSALVTDYSSIYMDYLLLDKPVLFLVPDLEEYVRRDRQFQFDFNEMTPGPKLASWPDLMNALEEQWSQDRFLAARSDLRRMAFDGLPQGEAVPKLLALMQTRGWIPIHATGLAALQDKGRPA